MLCDNEADYGQVYERGISCVTTSVDLWANYCTFKMDTSHDNDIIRE
jgi:pre-mRNA-processing factor 39